MSELAEFSSKFLFPALAVGGGTLAGCLLLPASLRSVPPSDVRAFSARALPPTLVRTCAGFACIALGFIGGLLLAARGVLGAVPAFRPQIEAEWLVWGGVIGAALGAAVACLRARHRVALACAIAALGALVVGVLELRLGLATAAAKQFPSPRLLSAGVCVLGVALAWLVPALGVMRLTRDHPSGAGGAPVGSSRPHAEVWAALPTLACLGASLPFFFYARSIKLFELSASMCAMCVAAMAVMLLLPRRGVAQIVIGASMSLMTCAVLGAHYYAQGPVLASGLLLGAPTASGVVLFVLARRTRAAWLIAAAVGMLLALGAGVLTRQANARPDDLYGRLSPTRSLRAELSIGRV